MVEAEYRNDVIHRLLYDDRSTSSCRNCGRKEQLSVSQVWLFRHKAYVLYIVLYVSIEAKTHSALKKFKVYFLINYFPDCTFKILLKSTFYLYCQKCSFRTASFYYNSIMHKFVFWRLVTHLMLLRLKWMSNLISLPYLSWFCSNCCIILKN